MADRDELAEMRESLEATRIVLKGTARSVRGCLAQVNDLLHRVEEALGVGELAEPEEAERSGNGTFDRAAGVR